jgi:hypothetical protein
MPAQDIPRLRKKPCVELKAAVQQAANRRLLGGWPVLGAELREEHRLDCKLDCIRDLFDHIRED